MFIVFIALQICCSDFWYKYQAKYFTYLPCFFPIEKFYCLNYTGLPTKIKTVKTIRYSLNRMVYFSTFAKPLYSTSDLRQIRYTTHPTYQQLLYGLVAAALGRQPVLAAALGPQACPSCKNKQLAQVRFSSRLESQQV